MSDHFLLTYSVKNIGDRSDEEKAEDVRKSIRQLTFEDLSSLEYGFHESFDDWNKLPNVETTIEGKISLNTTGMVTRRNKARQAVKELFKEVLKKNNATRDTTEIHCAMLIGNTGRALKFNVVI